MYVTTVSKTLDIGNKVQWSLRNKWAKPCECAAYFPESVSMLERRKQELRRSLVPSGNGGDETRILRRSRQLDSTEQRAGEERATQRNNSRYMYISPLELSSLLISVWLWGNWSRLEKELFKKVRGNNPTAHTGLEIPVSSSQGRKPVSLFKKSQVEYLEEVCFNCRTKLAWG